MRRWFPRYDGLAEDTRWRWVGRLLLVLAASLVVMWVAWPDSPGSIIDFETAGDDGAQAFLDAWTGWEGWGAAVAILADFPFLVAYGIGGALVLDGLIRWSTWLPRIVIRTLLWLAFLPIVAALCDVVENVALLVVIGGETSGWPDVAAGAADVKFVLLLPFYALLVVALVSGVLTKVSAAITRTAATLQRTITRVMSAIATVVAVVAFVSAMRVPGRRG